MFLFFHHALKLILVNGKGALIAKEHAGDFADKVLKILRDPELAAILRQEGIKYARTWQPSEMAKRMVDLYKGLQARNDCLTKPSHAC